jgi:hypothetical protein
MPGMWPRSRPVYCATLLAGAACVSPPPSASESETAPPITTVDAPSGGSTGGAASSSGDAAGSSGASVGESSGAGSVLDVGTAQDLGPAGPPGCRGKIDFLFVVARNVSMHLRQAQLIAAVPEFIATIEAAFADFDWHIMVVDADELWGTWSCNKECPGPYDECPMATYPCELLAGLTDCDWTLGAGIVQSAGQYAANKVCPISGGRRYMTREQVDVVETFTCLATLGISSDRARLGNAAAAAMQPAINGPGGCNEGFLRDDALLMITFISTTHDTKGSDSDGNPYAWSYPIIDAKHGDLESIVLLNIGGFPATNCEPTDRICQLIRLFPRWLQTDVEGDSYGEAFAAAAELLLDACAAFTPPG